MIVAAPLLARQQAPAAWYKGLFRNIQQIPISGRRIFVTGKLPNAKRVRSQAPIPIFLTELNALYGKIIPRQDQILATLIFD